MMLGELRAMGAFVTHVVGLHCALPSIAALRAESRVLRRVILSEMKAVRRFFSDTQDRLLLSFKARPLVLRTQSGKNNSDRVPKNKIRTNLVLKVPI